jgi:valyl-tRNA synthetase
MIPDKFLKPYDPNTIEKNIYTQWEESGYFNPDVCIEKGITAPDAEPFSIVLPPPNETGILHTGHASMIAIEDTLVRFHRMRGFRTVWVPGTDHAAIATNAKVEKQLAKKKISRHDIGREAFLEEVRKFTKESRTGILNQVRHMGASVDWSRYAYTLDEKRVASVNEAFKRLYALGLIYRGNRIINWDAKAQTTISDDEIVHEKRIGQLYTFTYSADFPIPIATTRPETKLGDTAVAVHPDDTRYQQYIGQTFEIADFAGVPLTIKIIADESIDPEYGTGALGVTPAHSHIDFEMAEKNGLPLRQVINEYAKMTMGMEGVKDQKTLIAREAIVLWLKEKNLLQKTEDIDQNISTSERTGVVVEPLPKLQWFIDVNRQFKLEHSHIDGIESGKEATLKELMLHVVRTKGITIVPERFEKTYFNWIENLRDWNISRQIWFGHRVPVWYRTKNGEETEVHIGPSAPDASTLWKQDPDTLDTWFSSALWTFSVFGWPKETPDFTTYHPTSVLETGYDIIFFWVARMVLMSTALLGEVPFKNIYLHGLVRDGQGRKISKSLGNNIDPIDTSEQYGTDALRMALLVGIGPGADNSLSEDKIRAYKKFGNKLWNITRFVLENTEDMDHTVTLSPDDQKNVAECTILAEEVTKDIENFRLYLAGEKLYHYIWHRFADEIIEESKTALAPNTSEDSVRASEDDTKAKQSKQKMLYTLLTHSLKLLHPFMPFITEEIWQSLPEKDSDLLLVAQWPNK